MEKHIKTHEQVLILLLKKGSSDAFDKIYQMYSKRLYAYSIQFTKSSEEAEEIVQDVFVNLWKNKENIRQNDTLESFLFIMAKHLLINAYRSMINHPVYEEYIYHLDKLSINNTYQNIEYDEFVRKLEREISKLPPTQQKVIRLSRLQELSNKEVAERLSLSEQTVKNQLSLGLKTLRENLDKILIIIILFFLRIFY